MRCLGVDNRYLKRRVYDRFVDWKQEGSLTLEVTGARQVGKTYIINKFADEHFHKKIYINIQEDSGSEFLKCLVQTRHWEPGQERPEKPLHQAFLLFDRSFVDEKETVVVIDEIQESSEVYNLIRKFTRSFQCRFIVAGSYLGRILNGDFKLSAGDLTSIRVETLIFEEFADAFGEGELLNRTGLYGESDATDYDALKERYDLYCQIGGYPAVVTEYLETHSLLKCREKLEDVIHLFCAESIRYFEDILDAAVYDNLFSSVSRILLPEKKGLDADSFNESLQKLVVHEYDSNISKAVCNRVINWLQSAGILDFAGKVTECRILDFKSRSRCFFTDVGVTRYFLRKVGAEHAAIEGLVQENFVFLELRRRMERLNELALEMPAFATYKGGEIDFYVKSLAGNEKSYAVEVKSGKKQAITGQRALDEKKVDCLLLLKGNTKGGNAAPVYTVPIYLFSKFRFDL